MIYIDTDVLIHAYVVQSNLRREQRLLFPTTMLTATIKYQPFRKVIPRSTHIMNNHNRKPNRLQHYDYSQAGYYLITICTQDKVNCFGEIERARMQLNEIGQIVTDCWRAIPEHFHNAGLDEFVVIPNHIHGVIVIKVHDFLRDDGEGVGNNDPPFPRWNRDRRESESCSLRITRGQSSLRTSHPTESRD